MDIETYIKPPPTRDYMFMASAHGLDSLLPVDPACFSGMEMACEFNQQRFAIYGTVSLTDIVHNAFQDMMKNDDEKQLALNLIKKTCYRFPKSKVNQYKHNMAIIPNPLLDPYGGKRLDPETDSVEITVCQK